MLDTKLSISDYVKKVAIPNNTFHFHKNNGKLTGYVPKVGQLIILEGFEEVGKVIKEPNSVKDFLIMMEDGTKVRKNMVNKDIEGYLDEN